MTTQEFKDYTVKYSGTIEDIKRNAHELHASVNQTYDDIHPYGFHLDMVAESVYKFGHFVCVDENDVLVLFFAAFFHDSIEDARLTYYDVMRIAKRWLSDEKALLATEIVYALTNDKGRTRAERAGEKYYQGIRETPYAPFIKLADRLANITYSFMNSGDSNSRMKKVYQSELPHFLEAISSSEKDQRYLLPQEMIAKIKEIVNE